MNDTARSQADSLRGRRGFLRGLLATGSGAAVLAVSSGSAVAAVSGAAEQGSEEPEASKGYHVTQQILDYYRTAAL